MRGFYGASNALRVYAFDETDGASTSQVSLLEHVAPQPASAMPPSLLKSLLQKSVRRGRTTQSLRLAKALMCANFVDFVRRFAVIIVEDGILHPDFPIFVWILVQVSAEPTWHPSKQLLDHLLQVVHEVAGCRFRDSMHMAGSHYFGGGGAEPRGEDLSAMQPTDPEWSLLSPTQVSVVKSLLARASFGGMKGDMNMLRSCASIWRSRLTAGVNGTQFSWHNILQSARARHPNTHDWWSWLGAVNSNSTSFSDWQAVGPVQLADCLLDGVDFHCSSMIDVLLGDAEVIGILNESMKTRVKDQHERMLQSLIWNFRSSINSRGNIIKPEDAEEVISVADESLFVKLRLKIDLFAYRMLVKYFPKPSAK